MTLNPMTLAELAEVRSGGGAPQTEQAFSETGHPFVRAGGLIKLLEGSNENELEKIEPEVAADHGLKLFPAGTVVFAKSGMSATKGYIYRLKNAAYIVNHLAALVPHNPLDAAFLVRALERFSPTALIKDSAYPSIRLGDIEHMKIIAPPTSGERQRIAKILDQADELRRLRQRAINRLNELGHTIFYEMFGDPIQNTMQHSIVEVGSVADCIVPGRDKPKSFTGTTPWITTGELIPLGETSRLHSKFGLTNEEIKQVRARLIPAGSVLLTCVGDLGITSIAKEKMVVNQQLHCFQCSERLVPEYVMYALSYQKGYMLKMATKTTVPYMNKSVCNSIPIQLPPVEAQKTFRARLDKILSVRQAFTRSSCLLDQLFCSLQNRAFRGES
jgi:type I restriction enzyme, S subunit